jgi:enediyne biosynthesis protein E4
MTRRGLFLWALAAFAAEAPSFRLSDVTRSAGLNFTHNNGAFGQKYLPETMGPGCAFLDYDNDGHLDILLINGRDWAPNGKRRSTMQLSRNNGNGTFTDVTKQAGLDIEMYGLGVAAGDLDNDGFPDLYITAVGQSRLFRNNRRGVFSDITNAAGVGQREAFSTSALWFDYDRDGLLDLFVCNYVRWSPELDVRCGLDGKSKSYCTPEAYRGTTAWLFRNKGDGRFEDVTAQSGIFDPSSKSLGVAMLDVDNNGWPDLFVANDTQPNKLYRNLGNGKFEESAVALGVAFSEDGKARAGMGVDVADYNRSGRMSIAVTNFDNEMIGLFAPNGKAFTDRAGASGLGAATRDRLGFGCLFGDLDLDGHQDLIAVNGHIDDTVRNAGRNTSQAQVANLFRNGGRGRFEDVASAVGADFAKPKIGRGVALGDYDSDGDLDVLLTTNGGPAYLYRNDILNGNRGLRLRLEGKKSNRDAIGAVVKVYDASGVQTQMVKSGSGYLSSSERALTFGLAGNSEAARVVIYWPSGRVDEHKALKAGQPYHCVEGENARPGH